MEITQGRLKELLSYDPATGEFRWLVNRQRGRKGELAGTICPMYGYRLIGVDYLRFRASRLAWFYMTGVFPSAYVDHVDRDRLNDSWSNLRLVTAKQNGENRTVSPRSVSGVRGVRWSPERRRWCAFITSCGKTKNLGRFLDFADALAARQKAEAELFTHSASVTMQRA